MNNKIAELRQKRGELLARIATQREQIKVIEKRWQAPFAVADKGWLFVRYLRSNPVLIAAPVTILLIRRNGVIGMAKAGWRIWKMYRTVNSLYARIFTLSRH
ncbi:MAG: YqjK-like family protein [Gallionellaceae bacterium]